VKLEPPERSAAAGCLLAFLLTGIAVTWGIVVVELVTLKPF